MLKPESTATRPRLELGEDHRQLFPGLGAGGVAGDDDVVEQPGFFARAPGDEGDLEAILLHVDAGGTDWPASSSLSYSSTRAIMPADLDAVALLLPSSRRGGC